VRRTVVGLWSVGLVSLGLLGGGAANAWAADGQADPSFGSGGTGLYSVGFGDYHPFALAAAQALQANGDVVIAGESGDSGGNSDLLVVRLTPSGGLDPSFGDGGVVDLNLQPENVRERDSHATSVAIAADGDIVVGGEVPDGTFDPGDGVVVRLTPDGELDSSFGQDGEVVLPEGDLNGLALTPGGDIVVTGSSPVGPGASVSPPCCLMVAELTSGGGLDGAFADGGVVTEPDGGSLVPGSVGEQVAVQSDGSIDVLGNGLDDGTGGGTGFVARFTAAGTLDQSFGAGGFASLDLPGLDDPVAEDLVPTGDGFLVTAGQVDPADGDENQTVVERFLASGQPDTGFGAGGATVLSGGVQPGADEPGDALAIRSDGSMLIAGSRLAYGNGPSDVWALSADGAPDDVFASGEEESLPGDLTAASTQNDGKVVFVGGAEQSDQNVDLEAIRLLGPTDTVASPGGGDPAPLAPSTGGPAASGTVATTGPSAPGGSSAATGARPAPARAVRSLPAHMSCRTVPTDVSHHAGAVCSVRIDRATAGRASGTLIRGRHVVATFSARLIRGARHLTITLRRAIAPGRYRLVLTLPHRGGPLVTTRRIRISG
jgi:uncharacterized delta-60 repeat protein